MQPAYNTEGHKFIFPLYIIYVFLHKFVAVTILKADFAVYFAFDAPLYVKGNGFYFNNCRLSFVACTNALIVICEYIQYKAIQENIKSLLLSVLLHR